MLFAAFGLMSLMVLVIWAIDPQYRFCGTMIATTVVLLVLALIGGIWTLRKARHAIAPYAATNWPTIGKFWRTISRSSKGERET